MQLCITDTAAAQRYAERCQVQVCQAASLQNSVQVTHFIAGLPAAHEVQPGRPAAETAQLDQLFNI
jgi:hypothetical protein